MTKDILISSMAQVILIIILVLVCWLVFVYFTNPSDVAASQFYGVGISGIGAALS